MEKWRRNTWLQLSWWNVEPASLLTQEFSRSALHVVLQKKTCYVANFNFLIYSIWGCLDLLYCVKQSFILPVLLCLNLLQKKSIWMGKQLENKCWPIELLDLFVVNFAKHACNHQFSFSFIGHSFKLQILCTKICWKSSNLLYNYLEELKQPSKWLHPFFQSVGVSMISIYLVSFVFTSIHFLIYLFVICLVTLGKLQTWLIWRFLFWITYYYNGKMRFATHLFCLYQGVKPLLACNCKAKIDDCLSRDNQTYLTYYY